MAASASAMESLESPVVVVGGGVSGCACAAALAAQGIGVTLVDPALDRLGEPSFGPIVADGEADGLAMREWLKELPDPLGRAWESATMVSKDGSIVIVDRRLVGLRAKQAIEQIECLRLRQGLAVEVTTVESGSAKAEQREGAIRVETAFGERLACVAVVMAVGLGLGESGTSSWLPPAGGLIESLSALGAEFGPACAEVGPSFVPRGEFGDLQTLRVSRVGEVLEGWGDGSPTSPYEREELWREEVLIEKEEAGGGAVLLSPDGLATGEVALAAGRVLEGQRALLASRPGYEVHGLVATNIDGFGRLKRAGASPPVWFTGRAAGSNGYVDSLLSGVRTAGAVAETLGDPVSQFGEARGE